MGRGLHAEAASAERDAQLDAVICWVDGAEPDHVAQRRHWAAIENASAVGTDPHRFVCQNELEICIHSIFKYISFIRTVHIVTDGQDPFLRYPSLEQYRDRIRIVDHSEIFTGYEVHMPTFSSHALEALIWRIEGLSEHFLYLNDDFSVLNTIEHADLFDVRGRMRLDVSPYNWVQDKTLKSQRFGRYPYLANSIACLNRIRPLKDFKIPSHYGYLLSRTVYRYLFDKFPDVMLRTISSRFRSDTDVWPIALHHNAALFHLPLAVATRDNRGLFCSANAFRTSPGLLENIDEVLDTLLFLCVNDWATLKLKYPQVLQKIERRVGVCKATVGNVTGNSRRFPADARDPAMPLA
jgi:hypothetical protein